MALQKDGWTITHDPLSIDLADGQLQIDLGAERLIAAQKQDERIAVEIKSFVVPSAISEFHTALGQCLNYRVALKLKEPERVLYLAWDKASDRTLIFGLYSVQFRFSDTIEDR